jgi:hypothetical protein
MYRGWRQTDYQNKHYNINQKDETMELISLYARPEVWNNRHTHDIVEKRDVLAFNRRYLEHYFD